MILMIFTKSISIAIVIFMAKNEKIALFFKSI